MGRVRPDQHIGRIGRAIVTLVAEQDEDRLIASAEAARALGVHRSTLLRWQRDGLVTPAKVTIGGQARWRLAELERQVDALREQ